MRIFNRWKCNFARGTIVFGCALLTGLMMLQPPAVAAQTDLSGYWVLRVPNGDGTSHDTYMEFAQKGDAVTGDLLTRGPNGVPISGTFKNGSLHFATTPAGAQGRRTIYDGSYSNGTLSMHTLNSHGATVKGVAERTTREASLPPARLPLPALHDVPDNRLARTPPMGWNSWNKFAGRVDDATVRAMADAMVSSGMSKLGYTYINIDDTWEGGRDAAGNIVPNKKFPNMKALADYVHSKGLKIGIYSSPGPKTCAGYEGSYGHELQDARTYAAWGIDYLKYDLCSARSIYGTTQQDIQGLYQKMGEVLQSTGRPIVFSLCEYGDADVWKWGAKTGGNLWRTTGDIHDSWARMDSIGFSQIDIAPYQRVGHWNDPDMLEVGNGGMNTDEYRTHMSLWSMLSAPLIAGNDLRSMSEDTKSILMNADVIAIDQDPQAKPVELLSQDGKVEVLWRHLHDGSIAVGIFNRGEELAQGGFAWSSLKLGSAGKLRVRDLWKHEPVAVNGDRFVGSVPPHGVILLRVSAGHKR
jgi:alpha-galactosidase